MPYTLYADRLLNPGGVVLEGVHIEFDDESILEVKHGRTPSGEDFVFRKSIVSPGLINSHDHLKYTWPERIKGREKYPNSYEWLPDLYEVAEKRFMNKVDIEDLYWLGCYKNIFSGVTTVANHCRPLFNQEQFFSDFPIRILFDFTREIFVRWDRRAHQMGSGAKQEAKEARKRGIPFVIHIAEGTNGISGGEIIMLDQMAGLFERSVLIHAINISDAEIKLIAKSNASVVWCPASNYFLFGKTAPIDSLLRNRVNVALGTDSTCTGSPNLISEMNIAHAELSKYVPAKEALQLVYNFVTQNAAKAFGVFPRLGLISPGSSADLLVFDSDADDPISGLLRLTPERIKLLTCNSKWVFREDIQKAPISPSHHSFQRFYAGKVSKQVAGEPSELIKRISSITEQSPDFFPLGAILES